jgi:hypothetical protein
MRQLKEREPAPPGAGRRFTAAAAAVLLVCAVGTLPAAQGDPVEAAVREVARIRTGFGIDPHEIDDVSRRHVPHGRLGTEVEGWRVAEDGGRWPVDQATFDVTSGFLSKYVNFENSSRRRRGEPILPMSSVSTKGDAYLALFYPNHDLSLEGIERYRVRGKESVYYELRYSPQPQEVLLFHPLARLLVNASTGSLYRFELAADYLGLGAFPDAIIGGTAAARIAQLALARKSVARYLGGMAVEGELFPTDLYYVRANSWLGAMVPAGGKARAAWVVPFRTARNREGTPHLIFVDALNGKILGGVEAAPTSSP